MVGDVLVSAKPNTLFVWCARLQRALPELPEHRAFEQAPSTEGLECRVPAAARPEVSSFDMRAPVASDCLDELPGLRCHVDGLALEIDQRPSEGADAIWQWRALVDQHELLAPYDTETSTHGCGRLEGLHPNLYPELPCGLEQFVKEMLVVHWSR